MTSWPVGSLASVIVMLALASCSADRRSAELAEQQDRQDEVDATSAQTPQVVALEDVGTVASFGLDERAGAAAVFRKPLDAAFAGRQVLVMDAADPWIRVFDRGGEFLRTIAARGEGPGEATRPMALGGTQSGGAVLSHDSGLELFRADGTPRSSLRSGLRARGAVEACGDQILALVQLSATSSAIVRIRPEVGAADTIEVFEPVRRNSRTYHPWFAIGDQRGLLTYSEEAGTYRMLEFDCGGNIARTIQLDSVGEGETLRMLADGRMGVARPVTPHPAGLARVDDRILWAVRTTEVSGSRGVDSLTVITAFDRDGRRRRVAIRGWYQIFDSDRDGWLLLGNSWTRFQNWADPATWGLYPVVHLINGRALVDVIDRVGVGY